MTPTLRCWCKQKLASTESLIQVLDPLNTPKRGYSITRVNGKAIKSVNDVGPGDILITTLPDGEIRSGAMVEDLE